MKRPSRLKMHRVGEKYTTNQGYEVEIVKYNSHDSVDVMFEDGNIVNVQYGHLKRGSVENYNHKSICNVGFKGYGEYKTKNNSVKTKVYIVWVGMIKRCYDASIKTNISYQDCSVDERWHNFQNFAKWFYDNYTEGWELDKDILIKGNKVYSPETCLFVPAEVNQFFKKSKKQRGRYLIGTTFFKQTGKYVAHCSVEGKTKSLGYFYSELDAFYAYKTFKEKLAIELAEKYSNSPEVHKALLNFKVELTD